MSRKVFAVIKREYLSRFLTKGFLIGLLTFPLIIVLIFGGYFAVNALFKPSTKTFYILDHTDKIYSEFTKIQSDTLRNGMPEYNFVLKELLAEGIDSTLASFQKKVIQKEIYGYLVVPADIIENKEVTYSARNVSDFDEQESFSRTFSWIVTNLRLEHKGMAVDEIRNEMSQGRVKLKSRQVTDEGEIEKSGGASYALCYILTYVMILMIMIYGITLMRSVIEEKSQRIAETVVSSIKPMELMLGKILGICGLGLTQLIIFGGFILIIITFAGPIFNGLGMDVPGIVHFIKQIHFTPQIFGFFILFFLLGFILYSSIFAAVGAMVNTEDEGQQYQGPIMILIWLGFFMMLAVAKNPETARAFWISLFPLYTPIVMFARIVVSDPILPSGAYLSIFTLILSILGMIWITAKIYRVGILMYGKKASLKEALKWVRYK